MNRVSILKCRKCRKLFSAPADHVVCPECTLERLERVERVQEAIELHRMNDIGKIAKFTDASVEEIEHIIQDSGFADEFPSMQKKCRRCRKNIAAIHSVFCLDCRMDLEEAFESAANSVVRTAIRESDRLRSTRTREGIVSSLEEKRSRIGQVGKGGFTPRNRWG